MYRVMIVEDEKIIRTGIASVVSRFGSGFEVAWQCADAYAAWDLFQAEAPDLVITDIVMRGMTGLEAGPQDPRGGQRCAAGHSERLRRI